MSIYARNVEHSSKPGKWYIGSSSLLPARAHTPHQTLPGQAGNQPHQLHMQQHAHIADVEQHTGPAAATGADSGREQLRKLGMSKLDAVLSKAEQGHDPWEFHQLPRGAGQHDDDVHADADVAAVGAWLERHKHLLLSAGLILAQGASWMLLKVRSRMIDGVRYLGKPVDVCYSCVWPAPQSGFCCQRAHVGISGHTAALACSHTQRAELIVPVTASVCSSFGPHNADVRGQKDAWGNPKATCL